MVFGIVTAETILKTVYVTFLKTNCGTEYIVTFNDLEGISKVALLVPPIVPSALKWFSHC